MQRLLSRRAKISFKIAERLSQAVSTVAGDCHADANHPGFNLRHSFSKTLFCISAKFIISERKNVWSLTA